MYESYHFSPRQLIRVAQITTGGIVCLWGGGFNWLSVPEDGMDDASRTLRRKQVGVKYKRCCAC